MEEKRKGTLWSRLVEQPTLSEIVNRQVGQYVVRVKHKRGEMVWCLLAQENHFPMWVVPRILEKFVPEYESIPGLFVFEKDLGTLKRESILLK